MMRSEKKEERILIDIAVDFIFRFFLLAFKRFEKKKPNLGVEISLNLYRDVFSQTY